MSSKRIEKVGENFIRVAQDTNNEIHEYASKGDRDNAFKAMTETKTEIKKKRK